MIVACPACQSRYDVSGRAPGTKARCRCGEIFVLPAPTPLQKQSCPHCAAPVALSNHHCEYCRAPLKVVSCPGCFTKVFAGSKHCHACGTELNVAAEELDSQKQRLCPRCESTHFLVARLVSQHLLDECPKCQGIWLSQGAFEKMVKERGKAQLSSLAEQVLAKSYEKAMPHDPSGKGNTGRFYVKCPDCQTVMNRCNFSHSSGIMLDVCRKHGTWFDTDELPAVIDFVQKGGLELSQKKQAERLLEEAKQIRSEAETKTKSAWMQPADRLHAGNRDSVLDDVLHKIATWLTPW